MSRFSQLPTGSQAAVMGTGIVSLAFVLDGERTLSRVLMWLAVAVWILLTTSAAVALRTRPARFRRELGVASLAGVAGTAVLGSRLTLYGWASVGVALLAAAGLLWLFLLPLILREPRVTARGVTFLVVVSTVSLSVLANLLAATLIAPWLLVPGVALLALGALLYPVVAFGFPRRELLHAHGDHWIAGGALAIMGLGLGQLIGTVDRLGELQGLRDALVVAGWCVWLAAMVWLLVLVAGEMIRPRFGSALRRWSTVFPLGMYAAMSFTLARRLDAPALRDFAQVWVWVAAACWLMVFAASVAGLARR